MSELTNIMLDCPFCGHAVDMDNGDTLYPNGVGWRNKFCGRFVREYVSFRDTTADKYCWSMHCPTTAGGCGVEISADSKEQAVAAWNKRVC